MNRYLLDTNVISECRKPKPHGAVIRWLAQVQDDELFVSAVTLGELQVGVERARRQDEAKAAEIELWIDQMADSYSVLVMDVPCFRMWARMMEGKPDALIADAMIAATAAVYHLVVVTRNERDFLNFDVKVANPFKAN